MSSNRLMDWLPVTKKEVEMRGWDGLDVILFSGDAYVDHPSFGAAVIGRTLEAEGLHVAIVPQPDWRGDYRDFRKLGAPRLFFGVAPGAMDSMINHYTANKRLRSDDAYSPDRQAGLRPDYPSIVYTKILKEIYPDVPVVLGGIEASMRRLAHYDYWQDRLRPGILADSPADLLIYGMGEKPVLELVRNLRKGIPFRQLKDIPQTVYLAEDEPVREGDIELFSFAECQADKRKQARNFKIIEDESNKYQASRIRQQTGKKVMIVNPPYPPSTETELDASYDLPYTRLPHPKYRNKLIPAFEMIRFSVNIHRGCFGGCAFCTISAHQGKFIASRSPESILKEVKSIVQMPDFKGYISDLGGPSANMYRMRGNDETLCRKCRKPSCIFPSCCPNLHADHAPLLALYQAAAQIPGIKKIFIGSGIRYDLLLHRYSDEAFNRSARRYMEELVLNHVSGRLKVAPEHTEDCVLQIMRKPSFGLFREFHRAFERINKAHGLNQQLIPYFISSHPGCLDVNMAQLAIKTKDMHFRLEQVQDFTPSPMTLATEMYYTGFNPCTMEKTYCARSMDEKLNQRRFFFWYQPENRREIIRTLRKMKREDLIKLLF
ncbi:MAG: YgiQ family radical SAM protein [Tannerella sp.]|nr:YgiQ family radical SAM protein [Tannerella sp.]